MFTVKPDALLRVALSWKIQCKRIFWKFILSNDFLSKMSKSFPYLKEMTLISYGMSYKMKNL